MTILQPTRKIPGKNDALKRYFGGIDQELKNPSFFCDHALTTWKELKTRNQQTCKLHGVTVKNNIVNALGRQNVKSMAMAMAMQNVPRANSCYACFKEMTDMSMAIVIDDGPPIGQPQSSFLGWYPRVYKLLWLDKQSALEFWIWNKLGDDDKKAEAVAWLASRLQ